MLKTASQWIRDVESSPELDAKLSDIYGGDDTYLKARKQAYIELLTEFINTYGDSGVVISRAPGRVNLMGRHIDHRGGGTNVMAINKDIIAIASPREDDRVNVFSLNERDAGVSSFSISEDLEMDLCSAKNGTYDWIRYIDTPAVNDAMLRNKGKLVNYIKAAVLRVQFSTELPLRGMNILLCGNIPIAAGLSSSSAIVVATVEAAAAINGIKLTDDRFIDYCSEGEWYVGSRGGAGDHAAMRCAHKNRITHIGFHPLTVGESVDFSDEYAIVVADSCIKAKKSEDSKDQFNQRIATYDIGLMLVKRFFPEMRRSLRRFRNLLRLGLSSRELYRLVLALPECMTRTEIRAKLPDEKEVLDKLFSTHAEPEYYLVRSVVMYGIAECARAEVFVEALKDGDYEFMGKLMNISHDGDRVMEGDKYHSPAVTDEYLYELIDSGIEIWQVPGGYACSIPIIDEMIDYVNTLPGVLGSEIVGAGLGGCIVVLVRRESADDVIAALKKNYYEKNGLPPSVKAYTSAEGSCIFI